MSEWEKMISGQPYDPSDPELRRLASHARQTLLAFNRQGGQASPLLAELFGHTGEDFYAEAGFHCDYGRNISVGDHFYANAGVVILDVCPVTIGDHCLIGPHAGIYTAAHPLHGMERRRGLEYGRPVTIGHDVWIGGHAVINPGVVIGSDVVVASGAVVTRNVPDRCVVGGNPAKIIRRLDEAYGSSSGAF
ncbi:sugar O-acetyltransferase [Lawsonibacter celer]|uniref:sugar O-acetyltransferase n=1 Tax=Lawsonibacter celer TaxID=2986526 RepID=UPI001646202E|nr:sugar O-acetyltransferase [Lawsonibacter celer]